MPLFMKIDGQSGPVTTPATRAGWFRLASCSWGGVSRVLDPQAGLPTNIKVVQPFRITREIDGASSFLYESMKNNVALTVTFASDVGTAPSTTWQLRSAKVSDIALTAAVGGANSVTENVELIYADVTVIHEPTKRSFAVTGGTQ